MLDKLGFIALVLAFGALLFGAGLAAPPGWRATLVAATQPLVALLPGDAPAPDAGDASAEAGAPAPGAAAAATDDAPKPVPYRELLIPTPAPAERQYAVEVAFTAERAEADALAAEAARLAYDAKVIAVQDPSGGAWWLVAVGSYPTPEAARDAGLGLARDLRSIDRLVPIMLPPPPAPPAGG